jgi:inosine-uridine nucleoside N-ribohydrolase
MHKVIYDTDPGVDDAMALVFQASHPDIQLLGVTSVFGNDTIDATTRNALFLVGRFCGPDVVVAKGGAQPLHQPAPAPIPHIHGSNALGGIVLSPCGDNLLDTRPAYEFIIDTVRQNPGEINLIAVGPLTNLALALLAAPDIQFLVKQVIVMGGAFGTNGVLGNVSPCAEANISADPHAADVVFRAAWTVAALGLDVTEQTVMSTEYLSRLKKHGGTKGQFVWDVSRHYEKFHRESAGLEGIYVHDSSTVAYLLEPDFYKVRVGPVRVVKEGPFAGLTVQKPTTMPIRTPYWDECKSQNVCVEVNAEKVLQLYYETLTR